MLAGTLLAGCTSPSPGPTNQPSGLPTAHPEGEAFQFVAPAEIHAVAGTWFLYSFCDPQPATNMSACGPFPETANPTGGDPPYHFQLDSGTGFPPFSLTLNKDGLLQGSVAPPGVGRAFPIRVCAVDLKADAVCRDVRIVVDPPLEGEDAEEGPEEEALEEVALAFAITSATCRFLRSTGPNDMEYEVLVKGTGAGPEFARLVLPGLPGYLSEAWASDWGDEEVADREAGEPEVTAWTATLIIGGGPSKTVTVEGYVRLGTERVEDERTLTCQSS